jgi:hypothetical protein
MKSSVVPVFFLLTSVAACEVSPPGLPESPPAPQASTTPPFSEPPPPILDADDIAHRVQHQEMSVTLAEEVLSKTGVFTFHNNPGASHRAYLLLLEQPDSISRFEALAERSGYAGQLYALCALSEKAPAAASRLSARLDTVRATVVVWDNDVRSVQPVVEVARMIRSRELWRWFRDPTFVKHPSVQPTG